MRVRIDLHTHSTVSDGTLSPADLVATAAATGVDTLGLTDHDSTRGWQQAAEAAQQHGIALVRGAEISCSHQGVSVHLLSYLHDPQAPGLLGEIEQARASRQTRARRMVELIAADYPLSWDDVLAQTVEGTTIGRPHIADALVARGHVPSRDAAFASILAPGTGYYVRHYAPDAIRAVRLVRDAGGVPVFAHPFASRRGRVVGTDVIEEMADAGLAGLEVDHRDHDAGDRARLRDVAASLSLLTTGSSDFHGTGKVNVLGENTTDPGAFEQLLAQARGCELVGG